MSRSRKQKLPTYSDADFKRIAEAIGKKGRDVLEFGSQFEAAAVWYRLDSRTPNRVPPSTMQRNLEQISNSARRLLKNLGIEDHTQAHDGPGDVSVFDVLASVDGMTEDQVASATARLGRMVAILEGIGVVRELDRVARDACDDVHHMGELTAPKGHLGDAAVNNWIACMFAIYKSITGSHPKTSVGSPDQPNEGVASGPLIRFLKAAGVPLGIQYDEDAWRSRVRTILATSP